MAVIRADLTALLLGKQEAGVVPYLPLTSKTYRVPHLKGSLLKVGETERKSKLPSKAIRVSFKREKLSSDLIGSDVSSSRISRALDPYSDSPLDTADDTTEIEPMIYYDDCGESCDVLDGWCGFTAEAEVIQGGGLMGENPPCQQGLLMTPRPTTGFVPDPTSTPHFGWPEPPTKPMRLKQKIGIRMETPDFLGFSSRPLANPNSVGTLRPRVPSAESFQTSKAPEEADLVHGPNGLNGVPGELQLIDTFVSEPVVRKWFEQEALAARQVHPWDLDMHSCLAIALQASNFNPSLPINLKDQLVSELSRPDRVCVWSFAPGVFRETEFEVRLKPHNPEICAVSPLSPSSGKIFT